MHKVPLAIYRVGLNQGGGHGGIWGYRSVRRFYALRPELYQNRTTHEQARWSGRSQVLGQNRTRLGKDPKSCD